MLVNKNVIIGQILEGFWKAILHVLLVTTLAYLLQVYFLKSYLDIPTYIPALFGTALAFFIGFNNNQAYDRWWEARKIWGALVNSSRTWAREVMSYTYESNPDELAQIRKQMIHRQIAFVYALHDNLRAESEKKYRDYLSEDEFNEVEKHQNHANAILNKQTAQLSSLLAAGIVDGYRFLALNGTLDSFCDEMGKSERIKNTVFPPAYQRYTRGFIWIFIVVVTLVSASSIGIWSIVLATTIGIVFVITHSIGLTLLNPFEKVKSGIPITQITRTIEINMLETLGEEDIPDPIVLIDDSYVM